MIKENISTVAGRMACATKGLSAWNWDAFPAHYARIVEKRRGKLGTLYVFDDNSIGLVYNGSATVAAMTSFADYQQYLAKYGLRTPFDEAAYTHMLVTIGEGNVYGVACDMNAGVNLATAIKTNNQYHEG